MSNATPDSMLELAAGYALGALTPEETRAFEAALPGSPELQRELAAHRELHGLLALGQQLAPPPGLKSRLMERVGAAKHVPFIPPTTGVPHRPVNRIPWALGAALAASLLLSVALGLQVRSLNSGIRERDTLIAERSQKLAEREATLNAILEPSVELVTMTASGERPPIAQVFYDPRKRSVIIHTFNLLPAPSGRVFQLWFLRKKGTPIPSQVFNTEPTGHQLVQAVQVPPGEEISGFALTVEPTGGSPQPTTTPFLVGALSGTK